MTSPTNHSRASGAAEELHRRRRVTKGKVFKIGMTSERSAASSSDSNLQLYRVETLLEGITEQLRRCLEGIRDNTNSLVALRQHHFVSVAPSDSLVNETQWRQPSANPQGRHQGEDFQGHHLLVQLSPGEETGVSMGPRSSHDQRRVSRRVSTRNVCNTISVRSQSSLFSDVVVNPAPKKRRPRGKFAKQLWKVLDEPESSREASWASRASSLLICVSLILTLIEADAAAVLGLGAVIIHLFCDSFFSLELLARFYSCPSRRVFILEIYTVLEVLASFPILAVRATCCFDGPLDPNTWPYVVLIACAPALRLLMILRRFEQIHLQLSAFRSAAEALPVMLYTLLILIASFAAVLYMVEPRWNLPSFADSIWLTLVTSYTVGYGETIPVSAIGRLVVSLLMVCSSLYMAIPIGIVGDAFSRVWAEREALLLVRRLSIRLRFAEITADDIPTLFQVFDRDENGSINRAEFLEITQFMNVNLDDAQALQLFNIIDADGSGEITDEEFVKVLFPSNFEKIYTALNAEDHTSEQIATASIDTLQQEFPPRNSSLYEEPLDERKDSSEARLASTKEVTSSSRYVNDSGDGQCGIGFVSSLLPHGRNKLLVDSGLRLDVDTNGPLERGNAGLLDI